MESRFKLFSDPVHGFISVPKNVLMTLIQRPEVQRLRRIRQLGLGHLVFPAAEHTRFGHALGAMALMQDALSSLSEKGTPISTEEHTAALAAALLHDIGHGPFSHTLEHVLIQSFNHEMMSRVLIDHLNRELDGALTLAMDMFDGTYSRPFFHELISSQLDMDRLDYLRRDAAFTGVDEGKIGVERIIKTLRVHPPEGDATAHVVVESKGVYAVENFILARRLMYWQVYLHKTVLAGDQLMRAVIGRAREHMQRCELDMSPVLRFFLGRTVTREDIADPEVFGTFCELDDTDVLFSLKRWCHCDDPVLADLSYRFINRDFFRLTFLQEPATDEQLAAWREQIVSWLVATGRSQAETAADDAAYYLTPGRSRHMAYERTTNSILILERDGRIRELSHTSDAAAIAELTDFVVKPYICYPKEVTLDPGATI